MLKNTPLHQHCDEISIRAHQVVSNFASRCLITGRPIRHLLLTNDAPSAGEDVLATSSGFHGSGLVRLASAQSHPPSQFRPPRPIGSHPSKKNARNCRAGVF